MVQTVERTQGCVGETVKKLQGCEEKLSPRDVPRILTQLPSVLCEGSQEIPEVALTQFYRKFCEYLRDIPWAGFPTLT